MFTAEKIDSIGTSISSAASPEQAAKRFHALVTEGLAQVIGDALAKVKNDVVNKEGPGSKSQGWEKYVTGCSINLEWPTPEGTSIQRGTPIFYATRGGDDQSARITGSISIGISVGF